MRTVDFIDGRLELIDQKLLPHEVSILRLTAVDEVVAAIKRLSVRGAPAIGVAGGYGVVLAAALDDPGTNPARFEASVAALLSARPTAVNLAKMVDRVAVAARRDPAAAIVEADAIRDEELAASVAMGERGADVIEALLGDRPVRVMTICNTGGLAAVERGTALAVIQALFERGKLVEAIPLETRPLLQGGRLTTWELGRMGAPHRLVVDSAAPYLLANGGADVVLIGADRIAANGDTANKIGSYGLALGAREANVPFIVVAPESTVDHATPSGATIEIEDRGPAEVVSFGDRSTAPEGTDAINPAFDVTPARLITAIVTDQRVVDLAGGESLTPPMEGRANEGRAIEGRAIEGRGSVEGVVG